MLKQTNINKNMEAAPFVEHGVSMGNNSVLELCRPVDGSHSLGYSVCL